MRTAKNVLYILLCIILGLICYIAISVNQTTSNTSANNYYDDDLVVLEYSEPEDTVEPTAQSTMEPSAEPDIEYSEEPDVNNTPEPSIQPTTDSSITPNTPEPDNDDVVETVKPTRTPTKKPVETPKATKNAQTKTPMVSTPAENKTETPKKTKEPVIPTIKTPKASGKKVFSSKNKEAVIDASNTKKGYVACKYSGDNSKVKVQIKTSKDTYNYDLPSDGEYVFFPLQMGDGKYTVSILENISGTTYSSVIKEEISVEITNANDVYLYPNQYVWFQQNSQVVKKSAELCNGLDKDIEKISAIFKYVTENITYDYNKAATVKSGYLPDVDEILDSGTGICFDYAAVLGAMCRAQGIPTKLVTGYVSPNGTYHAWNEVYTEEKGWITVTFYLGKKGFNLVDSTFYANMDSDEEAAEYIGDNGNYQIYHVF